MTIEEVNQKREELENQISDLIINFSKETGLNVDNIIMTTRAIFLGKNVFDIKVEVEL